MTILGFQSVSLIPNGLFNARPMLRNGLRIPSSTVGGSWIAPSADVRAGASSTIETRARAAAALRQEVQAAAS
jgi:2-dehydro-3-deoxyphosphogluconate aldolase/(4S)-4-hydroxy-2-oxoglutarate aldolase